MQILSVKGGVWDGVHKIVDYTIFQLDVYILHQKFQSNLHEQKKEYIYNQKTLKSTT